MLVKDPGGWGAGGLAGGEEVAGLTLNQIIFKHSPPSSIKSEVLLVYSVGGRRPSQASSCRGVHWGRRHRKGKRKRDSALDSSPDGLTSFCFQMAGLGAEPRTSNMLCESSPSSCIPRPEFGAITGHTERLCYPRCRDSSLVKCLLCNHEERL